MCFCCILSLAGAMNVDWRPLPLPLQLYGCTYVYVLRHAHAWTIQSLYICPLNSAYSVAVTSLDWYVLPHKKSWTSCVNWLIRASTIFSARPLLCYMSAGGEATLTFTGHATHKDGKTAYACRHTAVTSLLGSTMWHTDGIVMVDCLCMYHCCKHLWFSQRHTGRLCGWGAAKLKGNA